MMKNIVTYCIIVICLLFHSTASTQVRKVVNANGRERVEAVKIAFFTRQMHLTPEEAREFWPLYDRYEEKVKQQRIERQKTKRDAVETLDQLSDSEINQLIDNRIQQAEKLYTERVQFITAMREILPPRKVADFFRAEELFKQKLMERMNDPQRPKRQLPVQEP